MKALFKGEREMQLCVSRSECMCL